MPGLSLDGGLPLLLLVRAIRRYKRIQPLPEPVVLGLQLDVLAVVKAAARRIPALEDEALWGHFPWAREYSLATVGAVNEDTVRDYISS